MKNIPTIIHILIEEHNEDWAVYYLWTSPELEWLLIEADSIEEFKEIAPWVIKAYIETINDIEKNKKNDFLKNLISKKTLNIFYNWEQQLTLA